MSSDKVADVTDRSPLVQASRARRLRDWLPLAFLLSMTTLAVLAACSGLKTRSSIPQGPAQTWWEGLGPVVRHETFPADCSLCHVGGSWNKLRDDFEFDHEAQTGIALEGAHSSARCLRCHNDRGPVENFARQGCSGCHEDVHRGQMGRRCETCHEDQTRWKVADAIAQHDQTRFPLVGAHAAAACFRCHPGAEVGVFARADVDCITCHRDDLARAVNPDHMAMGFTDDCERCHVPVSWSGSNFVHAFFPLTAGHAGLDCSECHTGGTFSGTPSDCAACHLDDYAATSDPNHMMAGFPTSCDDCHSTSTWENAVVDHSFFRLSGGHGGLDCAQCHIGGQFQDTPSDCVDCHLSDFQTANDPNHISAGFPTDCQVCHTVTVWDNADFSHSFPINGGDHGNLDCNECHTMPSNFNAFSCIDCHEHSLNQTNDDHDRVNGYVYQSAACYDCHPDGSE